MLVIDDISIYIPPYESFRSGSFVFPPEPCIKDVSKYPSGFSPTILLCGIWYNACVVIYHMATAKNNPPEDGGLQDMQTNWRHFQQRTRGLTSGWKNDADCGWIFIVCG